MTQISQLSRPFAGSASLLLATEPGSNPRTAAMHGTVRSCDNRNVPASDNALTCRSCGAASPLPTDLDALEFDCRYCGTHQLLPEDLVERRRAQLDRQRRATAQPSATPPASGSSVGLGVVIGVIMAFSLIGVSVYVLFFSRDEQSAVATEPVRTPPPTVEPVSVEPPPPPLPEETETNNGLADVRARMTTLHEAGCDRVLIPPTRRESETGMTAKFDPSTHCVVVIAATGMPDTTVHLIATDAHGSPIDTPAAASAFEWRFCATLAGDHRLVIEHSGPGPYHAAAYDCPKREFAKLDPIAAPFAPKP